MSQNSLYLKYRPQTLDEIVGQDELVDVLKNVVKKGNPAHAYLLCGGRGTGKTTTARALAKALEIAPDDVLELDAASNNGVEEIKAISESANTRPFFSKYKMYILDEVHMLSKSAANAFLKTLEEPPSHTIFVLCTTDPEKLPDTILSRCVKFNLKSPNTTTLEKFLVGVSKAEDVKIGRAALNLVAMSGDGSFRDTLSNLQKVFSFEGADYSPEFVSKILGVPTIEAIFTFLESLDGIKEPASGLEVLEKLNESGVDNVLFSKELTYYTRLLLMWRHKLIKEDKLTEDEGENVMEYLKNFTNNKSPKINGEMLRKIIEAEITSKNSSLPYLSYELLLMN